MSAQFSFTKEQKKGKYKKEQPIEEESLFKVNMQNESDLSSFLWNSELELCFFTYSRGII